MRSFPLWRVPPENSIQITRSDQKLAFIVTFICLPALALCYYLFCSYITKNPASTSIYLYLVNQKLWFSSYAILNMTPFGWLLVLPLYVLSNKAARTGKIGVAIFILVGIIIGLIIGLVFSIILASNNEQTYQLILFVQSSALAALHSLFFSVSFWFSLKFRKPEAFIVEKS